MPHYINADILRNEIERLKGQLIRGACAAQIEMRTMCKEEAYDEVLSFLSTLESEKQMLKEAVEGEAVIPIYEGNDVWSSEIKIPGRYELGDKVRVIIVKE